MPQDKVMTMKEAISRFVHPGDTLFLSGAQHGEPTAAIHEIIRQKIDHLTIVCALVASVSMMVGEGLVDKLITGYFPQDENKSYALSKARDTGKKPVIEEYSHFGISMALLAGQIGIPFMPTRSHLGSDFLRFNPNIREFNCPFTGSKLAAIRAVVPDVGIIHVQRCDAEGNAQKWGSLGLDQEGINASRNVIVTTERLVDGEVTRRDSNRTIIPGFRVSAVVEQPWGAFPMHLAGCYAGDNISMMRGLGTREGYEAYLRDLIYGVQDFNEHLQAVRSLKGDDYFDTLKIKNPLYSEPVISGD